MNKVAFFVDGGYFVKRIKFHVRRYFEGAELTPEQCFELLLSMIEFHMNKLGRSEIYRVFYYDAPPLDRQLKYPFPPAGQKTASTWNPKKEPAYQFQTELHERIRKGRKFALRMGKLSKHGQWQLTSNALNDLIKGNRMFDELSNDDFYYDVRQKGVDTRLGVDITTIALSKYADSAVLIASDSDFVPAAKLARTHGMDVVLDPIWGTIDDELERHIDGKQSADIIQLLSQRLCLSSESKMSNE